jgi:uridine phosphorylase
MSFLPNTRQLIFKNSSADEILEFRAGSSSYKVHALNCGHERLAILQAMGSAPLAAVLMENLISLGCRKFIACGSAGLINGTTTDRLFVPITAVRDEGTSYHYLSPSREVGAHPAAIRELEMVLNEQDVPYAIVKTWTTDAPYRETESKIRLRRQEGCSTVEMETAALYAVARFRDVMAAQVLYVSEDLRASKVSNVDRRQLVLQRSLAFNIASQTCSRM